MTSTNDGKDVKSNQTSGPRGKKYHIELYKSLEARLCSEDTLEARTAHVCEAWRHVYGLLRLSAASTHPHLLSWLQRHTALTILQSKWQSAPNKDELHDRLSSAIDGLVREATGCLPWEEALVARARWFRGALASPWGHPVLASLLNDPDKPLQDQEVLEWLKEERGVVFVCRLMQLAASKQTNDLALALAGAVMDRARASRPAPADDERLDHTGETKEDSASFYAVLRRDAGFLEVWDLLTDIEFVLLHKREKRARCIELAKLTPLREGYPLVERLRSRPETSPRDKKLWKNAKEVATLIVQVIIARCMVVATCAGGARTALYSCARSLARLVPAARLPAVTAALAAPAATARHLHTLCSAIHAQCEGGMKPFVCELYVRAITAGMNELERLKLNAEKEPEARGQEQTLATWFLQLGNILGASARLRAECALTAFSVHPAPDMYERVRQAPAPPPNTDLQQDKATEPSFNSWANDSRTQSNLVKTSETLQLKHTPRQANVLSTAILTEGEALGLEPELGQDLAVLLSGPRVKTLSWDTDRELLLENCRTYMERTHGGTRALTTELKYLNLDLSAFQHLPEEGDDENDLYYGIEKGYEHLVQLEEPEEIWQSAFFDPEQTESADSDPEFRRHPEPASSGDEDPLSLYAEAKRERSKERKKTQRDSKDRERRKHKEKKNKKERKKKSDHATDAPKKNAEKRVRKKERRRDYFVNTSVTDSDYDSQPKTHDSVLFDGVFSMDELKSPEKRQSSENTDAPSTQIINSSSPTVINKIISAPIPAFNKSKLETLSNTQKVKSSSSDSDVSRSRSPYLTPNQLMNRHLVNDKVKRSISKLLQFRRNKNAMPKSTVASTKTDNTKTDNVATPATQPLTATTRSEPSVCLDRKQTQQLESMNHLLNTAINIKNSEMRKTNYFDTSDYDKLMSPQNVYNIKNRQEAMHNASHNLQNANAYSDNRNAYSEYLQNSPHKTYSNYMSNQRSPSSVIDTSYMSPTKQADKYYGLNTTPPKPENRLPQQTFHKSMQNLSQLMDSVKTNVSPTLSERYYQQYSNKALESSLGSAAKSISQLLNLQNPSTSSKSIQQYGATPKTTDEYAKTYQAVTDRISQSKVPVHSQPSPNFSSSKHLSNSMHNIVNEPLAIQKVTRKYSAPRTSHPGPNNTPTIHKNDAPNVSRNIPATYAKPKIQQGPKQERPTVNPPPKPQVRSTPLTEAETQSTLKEFLKELQDTINAGVNDTGNFDSLVLNNQVKVTPVNPGERSCAILKADASAKQTKPQKKTETAPNTFSRLSYMHKNKQSEIKNKAESSDHSDLNKLNKSIIDHKLSKAKYIKNEVTISRVPKQSPVKKTEKAQCDLQKSNPVLSCMLSSSPVDPHKRQSNVITNPGQTSDSINREHADLLLLLRNQQTLTPNARVPSNEVDPKHNVCKTQTKEVPATCQRFEDYHHVTNKKEPVIVHNPTPKECTKKVDDQQDWASVMNAIRQHKTQPLGPNALDMALESDKKPTQSTSRSHASHKQKPSSSSSQNNNEYKKRDQSSSRSNSAIRKPNIAKHDTPKSHNRTEVIKKTHETVKKHENLKQYINDPLKQVDPFISGIPNSDYDLLEELMDDDLRQEIGELSSDEDRYQTQTVSKGKGATPKISNACTKVSGPPKAKPPVELKTICKNAHLNVPNANCARNVTATGYANVMVNPLLPDARPEYRPTVLCSNIEAQHMVPNVIPNPPDSHYIANIPVSAHMEPANLFITSIPAQPMVLISQEIVPYPTISIQESQVSAGLCNVAPNTFVALSPAPNIAVYQTTQFAAPVINPVFIGNAMTTTTNVTNATEQQPSLGKPQAQQSPVKVTNSVENKPTQGPNVTEKQQDPDINMNKCSERKVLSQMQDNNSISVAEKDHIRRSSIEKHPVKSEQDEERLKMKRQALMNREINHACFHPPIPLSYTPLSKKRNLDKLLEQTTPKNGAVTSTLKLRSSSTVVTKEVTPKTNAEIPKSGSNKEYIETSQTLSTKENQKKPRTFLRSFSKSKTAPGKFARVPLCRNKLKPTEPSKKVDTNDSEVDTDKTKTETRAPTRISKRIMDKKTAEVDSESSTTTENVVNEVQKNIENSNEDKLNPEKLNPDLQKVPETEQVNSTLKKDKPDPEKVNPNYEKPSPLDPIKSKNAFSESRVTTVSSKSTQEAMNEVTPSKENKVANEIPENKNDKLQASRDKSDNALSKPKITTVSSKPTQEAINEVTPSKENKVANEIPENKNDKLQASRDKTDNALSKPKITTVASKPTQEAMNEVTPSKENKVANEIPGNKNDKLQASRDKSDNALSKPKITAVASKPTQEAMNEVTPSNANKIPENKDDKLQVSRIKSDDALSKSKITTVPLKPTHEAMKEVTQSKESKVSNKIPQLTKDDKLQVSRDMTDNALSKSEVQTASSKSTQEPMKEVTPSKEKKVGNKIPKLTKDDKLQVSRDKPVILKDTKLVASVKNVEPIKIIEKLKNNLGDQIIIKNSASKPIPKEPIVMTIINQNQAILLNESTTKNVSKNINSKVNVLPKIGESSVKIAPPKPVSKISTRSLKLPMVESPDQKLDAINVNRDNPLNVQRKVVSNKDNEEQTKNKKLEANNVTQVNSRSLLKPVETTDKFAAITSVKQKENRHIISINSDTNNSTKDITKTPPTSTQKRTPQENVNTIRNRDKQVSSTNTNPQPNKPTNQVDTTTGNTNLQKDPKMTDQVSNTQSSQEQGNQDKSSLRDLNKDDIIIEEIPILNNMDPNKKCVRVKFPNGKSFKVTVQGKTKVDYDTLFADPAMRAILKQGLCDGKRYTVLNLNITQINKAEKDPTKKPDMKIREINIKEKTFSPVDTVNLISDDEEDDKRVFSTEFGKFSTNIDLTTLSKHQKKFDQKCSVKLTRDDIFKSNRTKPKPKSFPSTPISLLTRNKSKLVAEMQNNTLAVPQKSANTISEQNSLPPVHSNANMPNSGVHIPTSSLLQNTVLPKGNKPESEIIEIDDSSSDCEEVPSLLYTETMQEPVGKIDELKNMLLKDLGVVDKKKDKTTTIIPMKEIVVENLKCALLDDLGVCLTPTKQPEKSVNVITENEKKFEVKNCVVLIPKCEDLIKKYELIKNAKNCFVKLQRCNLSDVVTYAEASSKSDNEILEPSSDCNEDLIDFDVEEFSSPQLSRCPSISILNNLWDDTCLQSTESLYGRSSPVMEIFDALVSLRDKSEEKIKLVVTTEALKVWLCDTEWTMSKHEHSVLEKLEETDITVINGVSIHDHIEILQKFTAPRLLTIVLKFLENNSDVIYRMHSVRIVKKKALINPSNNLKRKPEQLDNNIPSKMLKLGTLVINAINTYSEKTLRLLRFRKETIVNRNMTLDSQLKENENSKMEFNEPSAVSEEQDYFKTSQKHDDIDRSVEICNKQNTENIKGCDLVLTKDEALEKKTDNVDKRQTHITCKDYLEEQSEEHLNPNVSGVFLSPNKSKEICEVAIPALETDNALNAENKVDEQDVNDKKEPFCTEISETSKEINETCVTSQIELMDTVSLHDYQEESTPLKILNSPKNMKCDSDEVNINMTEEIPGNVDEVLPNDENVQKSSVSDLVTSKNYDDENSNYHSTFVENKPTENSEASCKDYSEEQSEEHLNPNVSRVFSSPNKSKEICEVAIPALETDNALNAENKVDEQDVNDKKEPFCTEISETSKEINETCETSQIELMDTVPLHDDQEELTPLKILNSPRNMKRDSDEVNINMTEEIPGNVDEVLPNDENVQKLSVSDLVISKNYDNENTNYYSTFIENIPTENSEAYLKNTENGKVDITLHQCEILNEDSKQHRNTESEFEKQEDNEAVQEQSTKQTAPESNAEDNSEIKNAENSQEKSVLSEELANLNDTKSTVDCFYPKAYEDMTKLGKAEQTTLNDSSVQLQPSLVNETTIDQEKSQVSSNDTNPVVEEQEIYIENDATLDEISLCDIHDEVYEVEITDRNVEADVEIQQTSDEIMVPSTVTSAQDSCDVTSPIFIDNKEIVFNYHDYTKKPKIKNVEEQSNHVDNKTTRPTNINFKNTNEQNICEGTVENVVKSKPECKYELIQEDDWLTVITTEHDSADSEAGSPIVKRNDILEETESVRSSDSETAGVTLKGIEIEDPVIGTCYVFALNESGSSSNVSNENMENQENGEEKRNYDPVLYKDFSNIEMCVIAPKVTYCREHLKRKMDMRDIKMTTKKYRKGKNIDCPKQTITSIIDSAYSKEYKRLFEYCSSVKFSYSRPFHKECVEVDNMTANWPINKTYTDVPQDEPDENLFFDIEVTPPYQPDPATQTFVEEITHQYKKTETDVLRENPSVEAHETNFNMGFGEGSGRVIQNLKNGGDSNISAATLSDVKQTQPVFMSEDHDNSAVLTNMDDQIKKIRQYVSFIELRDKVRSFFKKTSVELKLDWIQQNIKEKSNSDTSGVDCTYDLCSLDYVKPPPTDAIVQVVQLGQLPVSAAAQNPVTCDPRVTQVSDASPSQCSVDNSPNDDSQSEIKTEYTELTTADLTLPIVQEYAQNQTMNLDSHDENDLELTEQTISLEMEIKEELPEVKEESSNSVDNADLHTLTNATPENIEYLYDNGSAKTDSNNVYESSEQNNTEIFPQQRQQNGSTEKTDQIAHAMSAAGITTMPESLNNSRAHALVNILSQKIRQGSVNTTQTTTNTYSKTTSINAMSLQQALAQILPPPLNQTSSENNQTPSANVGPQVLHIVQGKNASGNQITLVDNSQQSVISAPNATQVLHIVQNKGATTGQTSNGTLSQQPNSFSGLSLVDAGLQQGGNQLLHIVNTGNQKNANAGQLLKRVNLLTNLANVQGSNEQKMVQFVCKSADGKAIQLNAPHQRSMVLRLQPIETSNVQTPPAKPTEPQELSPSPTNSASNKETANQQEIKSRSIYEENYAKFIQNSSSKTPNTEKSTSLPKFNQAFGKAVFQEGSQKPAEGASNNAHLPVNTHTENSECPPTDNAINLEAMRQISSPPLLIRKPVVTTQSQSNIVQQIKQTIAPMNIQTMHGGVIYTRQIPVNIGGGQTINLITVPSTELINEETKPQASNQSEGEPSIIKIVPQNQSSTNAEGSQEENNTHMNATNESAPTPQPQPVLTQMRIKLPMLSKAPQMVPGARVVRPSFFQIQRNVIGGANQPVYQQLVLTAAPSLGQQTIRLPQAQTTRPVKVPSENQSSSSESQMSSSTLEQLREFDMVLEQVKERSTVQPGTAANNSTFKLQNNSSDATDGNSSSNCSSEPTQVLYSIGNNQSLNVAYVNRKATVTTPTTSTFVRSPDSTGVADSPTSSTHTHIPHTVTSDSSPTEMTSQSKPAKVSSKSKSRPKSSSNPPNTLKLSSVPPKTSSQKPLEDEQTTQRILYILAEYKEQVENSPDKDKPAPRRRSNPPSNPGSSKRKKSSSSRRSGTRDMSPVHGEDTCRTMGSEDSSCGTSQGDCNESCLDSHSPQDSPRKVARKITFDQEPATQPRQPQRNVIVADGQTITVARSTTGKPATAVLMPANYILPVSMMKGGQQIAIVTNRGPKLLTVGGGEAGAANALLLQRLIGPGGLKPVLARPGVRHVRLPTAALHNLQAFNLATTTVQPPDSTASPTPGPTPPELVDTRATSSPWTDREDVKPERGSSPEGSEPWNLPSSAEAHEYTYEETVRTDNMERTVLDPVPGRYSPDMEAQRIFDKMFDVEKKSYVDSSRCAYDIDATDGDDKAYQVVQKKDGTHRQHRLTHVSAAALRHKYAILEHELRLQKSLSEECEDLGVDSPSASELFPEAELLFAASPAHEHAQEHEHAPQAHPSTVPQPDMDDQIATDQLLPRDVPLGLDAAPLDHEEFARHHPNTTFTSEPDAEVQPFTITGLKARHITSTIFHSNSAPATVLMAAPSVIAQPEHVKYEIEGMINMPHDLSSLVKEDGLTRFDTILTDRELHLSNTASAIVHPNNAAQVIRRVCYEDDKRERDARYLIDEPDNVIAGDDAKMVAEDTSSRDATMESMADVDDDRSSPERHAELFWESNSASERSESRRPLDFSSDSDKCCKSPFDETNSTDSSGVGAHLRLDSVIKEARGRERSGSAGSDDHPPLRTYPPKRPFHADGESVSGKTRAGERSPDGGVRRRASGRGVVKRGCHCCSGSPLPARAKKPRQRKPTLDFTN